MPARGAISLFAILVLSAALAPVRAETPGEVFYEFPPAGAALPGVPGTGLHHTTQNVSSSAFVDQIIDQSRLSRGDLVLPPLSSGPAPVPGSTQDPGAGASAPQGSSALPGVVGPLGSGVSSGLQINGAAGAGAGVGAGATGNVGVRP